MTSTRRGPVALDPRDKGVSEETFGRSFVECPALGGSGVQWKNICPDECLGYLDAACPKRDDQAGPPEEETNPQPAPKPQSAPTEPASAVGELAPTHEEEVTMEEEATQKEQSQPQAMPRTVESEPDTMDAEPGALELEEEQGPEPAEQEPGSPEEESGPPDDAHEKEPETAEPAPEPEAQLLEPGATAVTRKEPLDLERAIEEAAGSNLDPEAVPDEHIQRWYVEAQDHGSRAVARAILIGRALTARKKTLKRGKFGPWLEGLEFSKRTGQLYMQVAKAYEEKRNALRFCEGLSLRQVAKQLQADPKGEKPARKKPTHAEILQRHIDAIKSLFEELSLQEKKAWLNQLQEELLQHEDDESEVVGAADGEAKSERVSSE